MVFVSWELQGFDPVVVDCKCLWFQIVNQHLLTDLTEIGIWDDDMKNLLIANNGSVQVIPSQQTRDNSTCKTHHWGCDNALGYLICACTLGCHHVVQRSFRLVPPPSMDPTAQHPTFRV